MSGEVFDMELVEYAAGDATFELDRGALGSDVSLVLPLADWDRLNRPAAIRVSVEVLP